MPTAEELAQSQNQQPPAASDDDAKLGNIVNAAVTAHLKRANIGKLIADSIDLAMKPVKEQLEAAAKQPAPEPAKPADPKSSPEYAAMQRQLDEVRASFKTESEARAAAEKRQREDRAFSDLRAGLAAKGIKPDVVDVVARDLFHGQKRIEFDEQGTPLYRHTKSTPGFGDEDELLPLSSGIEAFTKSKDAAPFLPAPSASKVQPIAKRSSSNPNPGPLQPTTATSDEDRVANALAREEALRAQFPNL